ncbi:hypothetical protein CDAR_199391 [Caerostris darwini]|uniref:Uncharacterized protein n=1 Tax=Caerostris darwini TaxID=1538125 RepID=A0AAV4X089_9ARAC|nr:hypothetical protein CDAR_199391 [Caerostris darwini]
MGSLMSIAAPPGRKGNDSIGNAMGRIDLAINVLPKCIPILYSSPLGGFQIEPLLKQRQCECHFARENLIISRKADERSRRFFAGAFLDTQPSIFERNQKSS